MHKTLSVKKTNERSFHVWFALLCLFQLCGDFNFHLWRLPLCFTFVPTDIPPTACSLYVVKFWSASACCKESMQMVTQFVFVQPWEVIEFCERCHMPKFLVIILKYDSVGIRVFTAICDTVKCWCHCTKALPLLIFYQWCG